MSSNNITWSKKQEIIAFVKKGSSISSAAREFQVSKSFVSNLMKKQDQVTEAIKSMSAKDLQGSKRQQADVGRFPLLELALHRWILAAKVANLPFHAKQARNEHKTTIF